MTKNNFDKGYKIARMALSLNVKSRRNFNILFYAPRQQKIFRCPGLLKVKKLFLFSDGVLLCSSL